MYVINPNTHVVNKWDDSEINYKRLATGKYGVVLFEGEVQQSDVDGLLYDKEFCPMKTDEEKAQEEHNRIQTLSIGRSDFFDATIKAFGLDENDLAIPIENAIKLVPQITEIDAKIAMNHFRNAKDFYRKHLIFTFLEQAPLIIDEKTIKINSQQWDKFFDEFNKNNPDAYKELLNGADEASTQSSNTSADNESSAGEASDLSQNAPAGSNDKGEDE